MSPMTSVAGHVQIMVSSALHLRRISEQLGSCTTANLSIQKQSWRTFWVSWLQKAGKETWASSSSVELVGES